MRPTRPSFRPRWIVFAIVLVAGMLSLLDGVAHKDVTAYAGGGSSPAEAQEAPPTEEGGGGEAATGSSGQGGFYMHPLWLALVVVSVSVWLYTCSWLYDDAVGVGMEPEKWTSIIVGSGLLTVVAMFLLHAALGFLVLATVGGVFAVYVRERNREVPTLHRLFTHEHLERMFGSLMFWGGSKERQVSTAGFPMMRQDGQTLEHLAMDEEGLEEAASITAELITRAIQVEGRSLRVLPTAEGITAVMDLDGVMQNMESFEPELGNGVLRCISWLWRGQPGNEDEEDFKRMFYAQSPEHGKLPVEARPVKTKRGSGVVLTLPDWTEEIHAEGLGGLGMSKKLVDKVETELDKKEGLVLTSGPDGSGVTTSLYSLIEHIDIFVTEVLSIEEEIEFPLDQVIRRELDEEEGKDFEEVYKLALREEPDVIMFGELKDPKETATMLEFGLKNGMVLSSIKSDSSAQAIVRLMEDLKINPAALAKTLNCVTNQRLLRKLCDSCKEEWEPPEGLLRKLKINPQRPGKWYKPVGCPECFESGYRGRTALFELLVVNDEVRELLKKAAENGKKPSPQAIKRAAGSGFSSMQADGLRKVRQGITTLDEVRSCLGR